MFNPDTGIVTLNGKTYTPAPAGARNHYPTIVDFADSDRPLIGIDRITVTEAARSMYRLSDSRRAFLIARSMVRALRD
ncbi:hypothetical protein [Streptomyces sp. NTK 937]|uniref:hypothetical protein n=1 Tax=Streptomyces sp. NTK 937 TaxID=1487711 RepID=UPI0012FF1F54|nr:hypothetical protein [Streptomyces sp. NTK 937]